MAEKPNCRHRLSPGCRRIPLFVADYGFVQSSQAVVPFLVVHVRPWKITFATVIDTEGADPIMVKRLAQWMQNCGLNHCACRSAREPAIRKLLGQAVKIAELKCELEEPDDGDPIGAAPEESMVGGIGQQWAGRTGCSELRRANSDHAAGART